MLRAENYSREELERKKEEAERKARRGEIDPVHEYTFTLISKVCSNPQIIYEDNTYVLQWNCISPLKCSWFQPSDTFQITGLPRPAILSFMFEQPLILDELDLLYKGDKTKCIVFYYQVCCFSTMFNKVL